VTETSVPAVVVRGTGQLPAVQSQIGKRAILSVGIEGVVEHLME